MNEGLEGAAYLVLCYSSDGVMAPWISREWMSALARQLDGCHVKILPVLLTGGSPPAILADIKYADLVRDWDRGVKQLLRAIRCMTRSAITRDRCGRCLRDGCRWRSIVRGGHFRVTHI